MKENMRPIYTLTGAVVVGFMTVLASSVAHTMMTPPTTRPRSVVNAYQVLLFLIYVLAAAQFALAQQKNRQALRPNPLDANKFCYALIFAYATCLNFLFWHTKHIGTVPAIITLVVGLSLHYTYALLFLIDEAETSAPNETLCESGEMRIGTADTNDSNEHDDNVDDGT